METQKTGQIQPPQDSVLAWGVVFCSCPDKTTSSRQSDSHEDKVQLKCALITPCDPCTPLASLSPGRMPASREPKGDGEGLKGDGSLKVGFDSCGSLPSLYS